MPATKGVAIEVLSSTGPKMSKQAKQIKATSLLYSLSILVIRWFRLVEFKEILIKYKELPSKVLHSHYYTFLYFSPPRAVAHSPYGNCQVDCAPVHCATIHCRF